jgi:subtilisin family serine protease
MDFTSAPGVNGGPNNACDNHGTPVAGCVSAIIDNNLGTVGTAPMTRSVSARCFVSTVPCNGTWSATYEWTADALAWAETLGVRVTNNSNGYGGSSSTVAAKYEQTRADGTMVHFASAGNNNASTSSWPASLGSVNAVSALNRDGNKASFSNFGSAIAFSAPGETIYSTDRPGSAGYYSGDYGNVNGTSFASPNTAGVAALVLSAHPEYSAGDVEVALRGGAVDLGGSGWDTIYGWGFVNAAGALNVVVVPDPPSPFSLVGPPDGATEVNALANILFQWTSSEPGIDYTIVVSKFASLASPVVNTTTSNTFWIVGGSTLLKGTTYYWGVTAEDIDSLTTDSTPFPASFHTDGCLGDIDNSGAVNLQDLNIVLFNFGSAGPEGDSNQDGTVNLIDLNNVLFGFGSPC